MSLISIRSESPFVRSPEGGEIQKKLWKETIETLQEDTHTTLTGYVEARA